MLTNKTNLILLLLILTAIEISTISSPAFATCSIRTLKNVSTVCGENAVTKLSTDSTCPVCPEINCPTASLACIMTDSFNPLLKPSYTITGTVEDGQSVIFKLNISKNNDYTGSFFYDVRYRNFQIALKDNIGFLIYDVVNFNLPYEVGEQIYSFSCIGGIDTSSVLRGSCSTIYKDSAGITQSYSFPYIATPDESPIQ